jgi:hypothetical protein
MTLASRIFSKSLPTVSKKANGSVRRRQRGVLSRFENGYHATVFPRWWNIMPSEDSVKQFREKGYGTLRKVPQGPVRDTVRARWLANLESLDGFKDLRGAG